MLTLEQQQQLVLSHLKDAEQIAYRQHRRLPSSVYLEDVKSAAYYGLVDAASRYNGNVPFQIFASYRIKGEIQDYLRKIAWGTRNIRWQKQSWDESYDYASEPEIEINDYFDTLIARLSESERKVVRMYFVEDLTMKKIANKIGLSQTRVFQILKTSLVCLKETWEGDDGRRSSN